MAKLLNEIEWSEPILPEVSDAAWEADVKRRSGAVARLHRYVAPSPWLRETCAQFEAIKLRHVTVRLTQLGAMVTSQENSCRYCYGANRAFLRLIGFSESLISRIEREAQLAELDERERAFLSFCRNLARSNPRPAQAERDALVRLGYAPEMVTEMAGMISGGCFYNRMATLLACPPEQEFEHFTSGAKGALMSLAAPLWRALEARKRRAPPRAETGSGVVAPGPFRKVISALDGLPAADFFAGAIDGALASPVLPRRTKALMFAVVARALTCSYCQDEAGQLLRAEGLSDAQIEAGLAALALPDSDATERALLPWVRDTVRYQPQAIQAATRALRAQIGDAALLEAIGVAALANATVRVAMLLA